MRGEGSHGIVARLWREAGLAYWPTCLNPSFRGPAQVEDLREGRCKSICSVLSLGSAAVVVKG